MHIARQFFRCERYRCSAVVWNVSRGLRRFHLRATRAGRGSSWQAVERIRTMPRAPLDVRLLSNVGATGPSERSGRHERPRACRLDVSATGVWGLAKGRHQAVGAIGSPRGSRATNRQRYDGTCAHSRVLLDAGYKRGANERYAAAGGTGQAGEGMELCIIGRSSSHFTRVARVFAHELELTCSFRAVADLTSRDSADYAGNPALKLPVLETPDGPAFGAFNICRVLAKRSPRRPLIVWPESSGDLMVANAQELVSQGMATEVAMIMRTLEQPSVPLTAATKLRASLDNSLAWLDLNLGTALDRSVPNGALSLLEVSAFCFVSHLQFRNVADVSRYPALRAHVETFACRPSARATEYCFDVF